MKVQTNGYGVEQKFNSIVSIDILIRKEMISQSAVLKIKK